MSNVLRNFPFSPLKTLMGLNAVLLISYLALIATVMSYAALSVEAAQSVRSDLSAVGTLESSYLAKVSEITASDPASAGYAKPLAKIFVIGAPSTALNTR